jgi:hypothetical protein
MKKLFKLIAIFTIIGIACSCNASKEAATTPVQKNPSLVPLKEDTLKSLGIYNNDAKIKTIAVFTSSQMNLDGNSSAQNVVIDNEGKVKADQGDTVKNKVIYPETQGEIFYIDRKNGKIENLQIAFAGDRRTYKFWFSRQPDGTYQCSADKWFKMEGVNFHMTTDGPCMLMFYFSKTRNQFKDLEIIGKSVNTKISDTIKVTKPLNGNLSDDQ